jgi:hypothetical protein
MLSVDPAKNIQGIQSKGFKEREVGTWQAWPERFKPAKSIGCDHR